jgi:hypothetical protein
VHVHRLCVAPCCVAGGDDGVVGARLRLDVLRGGDETQEGA